MTPSGAHLTAFLVGLLGGVHCLTMCGGLVSTLTIGLDPRVRDHPLRLWPYQLAYNVGRIGGYAIAGALFGGLGAILLQLDSIQVVGRILYGLAGVVMILLGLYLAGWWRAWGLTEHLGQGLWRRLQPLGRRLLPVRRVRDALMLGLLWSAIPCGLVYSVLITAVSTGSPWSGAAIMLSFGAGTLPNLLGIGMLAGAAARVAEKTWMRRLSGLVVVAFGVYTIWQLVGGAFVFPGAGR